MGIIVIGLLGLLAIGVFLFFLVDDGELTSSVAISDEEMIDDSIEYVELLIDGGCKEGEIYLEEEESCSLIIDCEG